MRKFQRLAAGVALAALVLPALPATAQIRSKAGQEAEKARANKVTELPVCPRPSGTIALSSPENQNGWWTDMRLS